MKKRESACLEREMEQLTTQQLDELLQSELEKEMPNEKIVLSILRELRQREKDQPAQVTKQVANAWEQYQVRIATPKVEPPKKKKKCFPKWAVAAALCLLVIAFPFAVDADGTMDLLYRVKDSVVEFFRPGKKAAVPAGDYQFSTTNPGLQQVYHAVTEMGVTVPVVPMWLPEGYVLTELEDANVLDGNKLYAKFESENGTCVIQIKVLDEKAYPQYEQDTGMEVYDTGQLKHLIMENDECISAIWVNENVEGMINWTADKATLEEVLDAIYRRN